MQQKNERGSFTSKIGFVLAAAGSAVGMGNIWRFPYLAAQYGGGIFLLVYIILAVTFGYALMTAEIAIGRKTGLSSVGAYRALDERFSFLGYLGAVVPTLILPYYCVIGGWVTKYLCSTLVNGTSPLAVESFFPDFIAMPWPPLTWFIIFAVATAVIVLMGVEKGIEKVSTIMMPVLIVLTLFVAIYSVCLPGAMEGVKYYLTPNFSKFSVKTVLAAMGQMFYSMSIAMGIMITYGSYMKNDVRIDKSVRQIEVFDTGVAFLAGLMVIPAVFVFSGGDESALGKGPGLMFITLPKVFDSMRGGRAIGTVFFLLVLFAALTSSISLFETVVSYFRDKLKWSRAASCAAVFGIVLLFGVPSSMGNGAWSGYTIFGMDFLSFCDFITNSVLMPIVALLTCILVGYVVKTKVLEDEVELSGPFNTKGLFRLVIRYIAPICIVLILVSSVLDALGIVKI